ncbi:hypothetical protein ABT352_32935 [Streptosporangium sp. NPDC000563]|uniref:hypothetical protein n=1 Tax=Streptosporangium sp. NPDC000563 TaxID=3154366 RepID=UPI00332A1DAF
MFPNLSAPPQTTVLWPIGTRQYSPKSRRALRRTVLLAQAAGLTVAHTHDHGRLHRMHLLTLTGPSWAIRDYWKRMLRILPTLDRSGNYR